ncbi:Hypothetical protein D9617_48g089470 [Elsinoe fawcettii]|nr:Hypothetical protein D9617_48g089470 [Elsinoe fawcettii]
MGQFTKDIMLFLTQHQHAIQELRNSSPTDAISFWTEQPDMFEDILKTGVTIQDMLRRGISARILVNSLKAWIGMARKMSERLGYPWPADVERLSVAFLRNIEAPETKRLLKVVRKAWGIQQLETYTGCRANSIFPMLLAGHASDTVEVGKDELMECWKQMKEVAWLEGIMNLQDGWLDQCEAGYIMTMYAVLKPAPLRLFRQSLSSTTLNHMEVVMWVASLGEAEQRVLSVLRALDVREIPECFRSRATDASRRWGDNGTIAEMTAADYGVSAETILALLRISKLSRLYPSVLVLEGKTKIGMNQNLYEAIDWVLPHLSDISIQDAILLVAYTFPADELWEADFTSVCQQLLPLLVSVANRAEEHLTQQSRYYLSSALLTACRSIVHHARAPLLDMVATLASEDFLIQLRCLVERARMLSDGGSWAESNSLLSAMIEDVGASHVDPAWNTVVGFARNIFAWNLIKLGQTNGARTILDQSALSGSPMEDVSVQEKAIVYSLLHETFGDYRAATHHLHTYLQALPASHHARKDYAIRTIKLALQASDRHAVYAVLEPEVQMLSEQQGPPAVVRMLGTVRTTLETSCLQDDQPLLDRFENLVKSYATDSPLPSSFI